MTPEEILGKHVDHMYIFADSATDDEFREFNQAVVDAMKEYGKQEYNQALEDYYELDSLRQYDIVDKLKK